MQEPLKIRAAGGRRVRALIIEDVEHIAQALKAILEKLQVEAEVVMDGAEALERLNRKRYDVAFLDWSLPSLNGGEIAKSYRCVEKGNPKTVIIATPGDATRESREMCSLCGMNAFVGKPFNIDEIRRVLIKFFGGDRDEPKTLSDTR